MTDIQQAREWAERMGKIEGLMPGHRAAAEVIQSLPDQWIDAKKVGELADDMANWSLLEMPSTAESDCRHLIELLGGFADRINDLLAPPLPTLAELIEQGNDPGQYYWMQAEVFHTGELGCVMSADLYDESSKILFPNAVVKAVPWEEIAPLPGLPRMVWPDEHHPAADAEEAPEPETPRPEDVPAGEPWLVELNGHKWVGTREATDQTGYPWALSRLDGVTIAPAKEVEVTLVSRLVPEVKP